MKRLWGKLKNNWGKKLIALFFAVLIWAFVITVNDPIRTRTVSGIPLRIVGLDAIEAAGLIVRNQAVMNPVSMQVDVRISDIHKLNLNAVTVTADLSNIKRKGQYQVYLYGTTSVGTVVTVVPSVITLDVDARVTRDIPVSYYYTGQIADSLYHLDPLLSVSKVQIMGAQTDVERVTSAVCEINLLEVTGSLNGIYPLKLLDKDNREVPSNLFTGTLPSVQMRMEVYAKKTITISTDPAACIVDLGAVADGYTVLGVSFSQSDVAVYGNADVLGQLNLVTVTPVRINGLKANKTFTVTLALPKGVTQVSTAPIIMTVTIVKY